MPNPHDKSPILVTESEQLLLPMHERFLCVLKCASQVAFFQTRTFLHFIVAMLLRDGGVLLQIDLWMCQS